MCPLCWATAIASFGGLIVIAVLSMAGSDRLAFALASLLGTATIVHRTGLQLIPCWCFVALIVAVAVRVSYLLLLRRERLLAYQIWRRACLIAADRCPRRQATDALPASLKPNVE